MSQQCNVQVRFHSPAAPVRRYFTTFYHIDCQVADGGEVTDYILPEWANLRFHTGGLPRAQTLEGQVLDRTTFPVTGPSSKAIRFTIGTGRMFGVGLTPLGWTKFINASASNMADMVWDGHRHQAFARLRPLADLLCKEAMPDIDTGFAAIADHFLHALGHAELLEERIEAIHRALVDRDSASVGDLVRHSAISQRTIERVCNRTFGFPPKRLLRRQRFMRSLTHFLADPSLGWIGAIDSQYHDQSQFVHDFRHFMGMSPRAYAQLDKPFTDAVVLARSQLRLDLAKG